MLIFYYADSLGMPRSGVVEIKERYIYLFQQWLQNQTDEEVFVIDRAKGYSTIKGLYTDYKNDMGYFTGKKDILIIHEGVVDCAPRPLPRFIRNVVSGLPSFLRNRIIRFIHNNRRRLLKSGFRYHLTSKKKYKAILKEWVEDAVKNFARVYVVNIAPTTPNIEFHSPGFSLAIQQYNSIIKDVITESHFANVLLVDVYSEIRSSNLELESLITKEDGHHITSLAHRLYNDELIKLQAQRIKTNA